MEDIFQTHYEDEFVTLTTKLFASINVITSSVDTNKPLKTDIDEWFLHMTTALNHKTIKYAKAIERILGEAGMNYHACEHRDSQGLPENFAGKNLRVICNELSEADRVIFWKYIEQINKTVFYLKSFVALKAPSRQEIQDNIQQKKSTGQRSNDSSMFNAFYMTFQSLAEDCNSKMQCSANDDVGIRNLQERWNTMCTSNVNFVQMCNNQNVECLQIITNTFSDLEFTDVVSGSTWKSINKLNSFATVNQNIPANMMGRIENMASLLAGNISSGKMDMSGLNLNEIGKEVLSGCSEDEMQHFANNIDKILPALSNFQHMM